MKIKRSKLLAIAFFITMTNFTGLSHARSGEPVNVVATFSVLGDMVRQIGGNRINLTTLVGADSDAHVYQPTPADAQAVAEANLLIINGVGFEGWLERLIKASNYNNPVITATNGIALINVEEDESHHDEHEDHENKISLITAEDEGYKNGFWPGEKDEQSQAYAKRTTGNWLWQLDVDEFYHEKDLIEITAYLTKHNPSMVFFYWINRLVNFFWVSSFHYQLIYFQSY